MGRHNHGEPTTDAPPPLNWEPPQSSPGPTELPETSFFGIPDLAMSDAIWRLFMWFPVRLLRGKAKNKEKVADGEMLTLRELFYMGDDTPQLKDKPPTSYGKVER